MLSLLARLEPLRKLPRLAKYGLGVLLVLASAAIKLNIDGPASHYPFILFIPAILATALIFGERSGLVATAAGTLLAVSAFEPAMPRSDPAYLLSVGFFVIASVAAVLLIEGLSELVQRLHETERRATNLSEEHALLLSELQHRSQNNIQIISGILMIQMQQAEDATVRTALRGAVERVGIIGRIYSRLYRHPGLGAVADDFLGSLCADLGRLLSGRGIALTTDIAAVRLDPRGAGVVGLIVNELVTNALKYAFPDGRRGTVHVGLHEEPDGLVLEVRDDGIGSSPEEGTGRALVRRLGHQIGGTLEIFTDGGCTVKLRFPAPPPARNARSRSGVEAP